MTCPEHVTPAGQSRHVLIALLAYLALLMPALLPYGAHPGSAVPLGIAAHAHVLGVDPHAPHPHGGGIPDSVPADSPFLLQHAGFAAIPPARPQLPRVTLAGASLGAPAWVHGRASSYEPGRPRGPPPNV